MNKYQAKQYIEAEGCTYRILFSLHSCHYTFITHIDLANSNANLFLDLIPSLPFISSHLFV